MSRAWMIGLGGARSDHDRIAPTVVSLLLALFVLSHLPTKALALHGGPLSSDDCAAHRREAEEDARIHPGYALYSKGLSRLLGWCDPEDAVLGRAEIERAIAMDFDGVLIVEYVAALSMLGENARVEQWLDAAASTFLHHPFRTGRAFPSTVEVPLALVRRAEALVAAKTDDSSTLMALVSRFLSGPVRALRAEIWYLDGALAALWQVDPKEGGYLRAIAGLAGRVSDSSRAMVDYNFSGAAACGHPLAIRRLATGILSGETPSLSPERVASALLRLPGASASDIAAAGAVLARSGESQIAFRSGERQSALEAADAEHCWAYTAGRLGRPPR